MFDETQINDARAKEVYTGLDEEGQLETGMVDVLCTPVPESAIPGHAGTIKKLDFQAIAASSDYSGFDDLDADSQEIETPVGDRLFEVGKIQRHKPYPRGLSPDQMFQKIKESYVPHLNRQVAYEKDAELNTVLTGNGTAASNSQDVTVRQLSEASTEQWSQDDSDPLGNLRSACQDALANTVALGKTKANEIQDHGQFRMETGFTYATVNELARFLEGYLMIDQVVIGNKVYQDGAVTAAADISYVHADVAVATNIANLLWLDWGSTEFLDELVEGNNTRKLHIVEHGAIITVAPEFTIVFEDVA